MLETYIPLLQRDATQFESEELSATESHEEVIDMQDSEDESSYDVGSD